MTEAVRAVRAAELEDIRSFLSPGSTILEVGGGSGFQASLLRSWGFDVVSVDVEVPADAVGDVELYAGEELPFPDDSFDVVFSSNTFEHVEDVGLTLSETKRVLRDGGIAIHLLPSSTWRWWHTVAIWVFAVKVLILSLGQRIGVQRSGSPNLAHATAERRIPVGLVLRRLFLPQPHGAYGSAIEELSAYSRGSWTRVFRSAGWRVLDAHGNGLFYTGYDLWPSLSMRWRRRLSRVLGSACGVYILTPGKGPVSAAGPAIGGGHAPSHYGCDESPSRGGRGALADET